jgi:hypothetical protein
MAWFNGVFKESINAASSAKRFGVRGGAATERPIKSGNIQMNEDFTQNFMHKLSNNGVMSGSRSAVNIPNSPAGTRTQGTIASDFGARQRNYQHEARKTQGNIKALKTGMAGTGDDAAAMGVYQDQLGKANGQLFGIRAKQVGAAAQQAAAHIYRAGKYAVGEGTIGQRAIKTGAMGGAYMGGNTLVRGASGGGATYNNDGERDIAGIPFL